MKQHEINKLLEQYRTGTISPSDRHLLEQLATEDDFVFDSIQGIKNADASYDMDGLRTRLIKRVEPKKKRILPLWVSSAAAVLLLLLGVFWFINPSQQESNKNVLADAIPTTTHSETSKEENVLINQQKEREVLDQKNHDIEESEEDMEITSTAIKKEQKDESIPVEVTQESSISTIEPVLTSIPENEIAEGSIENDVMDDDEVVEVLAGDLNTEYSPERSSPPPPAAKTSSPTKKRKAAESFNSAIDGVAIGKGKTYSGIVTDFYGDPLIGASVHLLGTDQYASTDIDGTVQFVNVHIENPRVLVDYTGFIPAEVPIKESFSIQLKEGAVLEEVVVANVENMNESIPEIGWDTFHKMVEDQLQLTPLLSRNTKADIHIEFNVRQNGFPVDIKVLSGKENPKTSAILQLLATSGKWSPGKGTIRY